MATAEDCRRLALSLAGTAEAAHGDRRAFKVARIYATLAADGGSANLRFSPDEQALKCTVAPDAFAPVPNAWGEQGWTTVTLAAVSPAELENALTLAWARAGARPSARRPAATTGASGRRPAGTRRT
ncbi:MmcQ/YjbR family DNA-binding protein [Rhodoplanes roseus]|uniref:MmcQ/YjbR family DNA-binding protein n=1 Tax=Rhodoplanes roseus TaxID=29409 RepID=A0A327L045_9BRAD|nr:MmcQ/YjbR family DNA-binding protein [Rhodoplanes roseus]RAI43846.1 hypothetical protein CH341_12225 [Rhodoplanes roseus]